MPFWTIVCDTINEIRVKKLFWINLVLSLVAVAAMACWSFDEKGVHFLHYSFESDWWSTSHPLFRSTISTIVVNGFLISVYIGWLGTVLGLISTSGIFPSIMEKGAIDCVLARPIPRWQIFLAKYVGSLFFVAVQATFFVILSFLVMGWRWAVWFPGYLWTIPLLIVLFSYVYCMCVVFALWTRSGLTSLLLTLAFWAVIWLPQVGHEVLLTLPELDRWPRLKQAIAVLKWAVPNTVEIPRLAERLMDDTDPTEHADRNFFNQPGINKDDVVRALEVEKKMKFTPWYYSIGSSLLFEAVVLLLAGWRFSRKDF